MMLADHAQIMREMLKVVSQRTLQTNQQLLAEEPGSSVTVGGGRVYAVFSPRGGSQAPHMPTTCRQAPSRNP